LPAAIRRSPRQDLAQKLGRQISIANDQQMKAALTELRDMIERRRIPA
jgi:hypothetical protein